VKNNKKGLVIFGLAALCVILTAGVFLLSQSPKGTDDPNDAGGIVQNVTPSNIVGDADLKDPTIEPDPIPLTDEPNTEQKSNDIELTVIDDKPDPPDPPDTAHKDKEDEPQEKVTDPALTDPNKKPDSDPKPAETTKPKETTPNAGDKKDGKVYIPGFGWVDDEGGGGEGKDSYVDEGKIDNIIGH